jgi:hypothetical protein
MEEELKSNSLMIKLMKKWKDDKNSDKSMNPYWTIFKGKRRYCEDFSINDDEELASFITSYYNSNTYIVKLLMIVLNDMN